MRLAFSFYSFVNPILIGGIFLFGKNMPLESGKSKAVIARNIKKEMKSGKKRNQAIAIAYAKANKKPMG